MLGLVFLVFVFVFWVVGWWWFGLVSLAGRGIWSWCPGRCLGVFLVFDSFVMVVWFGVLVFGWLCGGGWGLVFSFRCGFGFV